MKGGQVFLGVFLITVFIFLNGCATTGGSRKDEMQGLKNQQIALETQLQEKDAEIASLRKALSQATEEKYAALKLVRQPKELVPEPSVKQIQTALKNAGFDPGGIDGKMGKTTRQAIKDFQKANNLDIDGKVGKKTWVVLGPYLDKAPQ